MLYTRTHSFPVLLNISAHGVRTLIYTNAFQSSAEIEAEPKKEDAFATIFTYN